MSALLARAEHSQFERRLRLVTAAGVQLPDDILALQKRLDGFRNAMGANPCRDRLARAIIDDDTEADMPMLWAATLAETTQDGQDTEAAIRAIVNAEVRGRYSAFSRDAYAQIAAAFNEQATAFTKAAQTVDVETPAELVVGEKKTIQDAWQGAQAHALRMTSMLPAITAAAALAGVCNDKGGHEGSYLTTESVTGPDVALALVVDTTGHDRGELWQAWDVENSERIAAAQASGGGPISRPTVTVSRCGRWSALHRLGAPIHAVDLDDYRPYGRIEPVEPTNDPLTVGVG